ncbi:MAG: lipoprotein-releasing ABC transporter permease subunit [Pseudomonadota bacterium]
MLNPWRGWIALRYTRAGASDRLVSFMSLISIFGLVLGVAVLVIVLSVMNGFERELRERVLGFLPHGVIFRDGGFENWQTMAHQFESDPAVLAAAPFAEGAGLLVTAGNVSGVSFNGIDPAAEKGVSIIGDYIQAGSLDLLQPGSFRAAMGAPLAARLGLGVGDTVTLVLPDAQLTLAGPLPRTRRFEIVALFEVGSDADTRLLLVNIVDANRLLRVPRIDGIRLRLEDLFAAPEVLSRLTRNSDSPGLYASSWMRRYGNLYDAIALQKSTMFLLLLMLVAVAAFNVVSNLVMTVDDKRGDIAILRTLGATPGAILAIFVMHGALVGAIGIVLGIGIGVTVSLFLSEIYRAIDKLLGLGLMDEYFIHYLPSQVLPGDVLSIAGLSFVICLLATFYPALRAARAKPVEALQYDS